MIIVDGIAFLITLIGLFLTSLCVWSLTIGFGGKGHNKALDWWMHHRNIWLGT